MATQQQVNSTEIIDTIDYLSVERGIPKESIISIIESAAVQVSKNRYGSNSDIVARVNRKSGEISVYRIMTVVEVVEDIEKEVNLAYAKRYNPEIKVGETIHEPLPSSIQNERNIANSMKGIILKGIKSTEREAEYREYIDRKGEIITGVVRKIAKSHIIVGIGGRAEGIILQNGMIKGERFSDKDKITACIEDVKRSDDNNSQIILSRTSNEFLKKLFQEEVKEIAEGMIEIRAVARDPGSRAKIAVFSHDSRFDAVGACIGPRGNRVKEVINELKGEKIDIILWDRDITEMAKAAIAPAKAIKATYIPEKKKIEIIVTNDSLNMAIGRRGQNARLVSQLLGCDIDLISESDKQAKIMEKFKQTTNLIVKALDVEDIIAQLLVAEGFMTIDSLINEPIERIAKIQGFDAEIAAEIKERAADYKAHRAERNSEIMKDFGVDSSLAKFAHLNDSQVIVLSNSGIKTLQEMADLAADELIDFIGSDLISQDDANKAITEARKIVFNI